MPSLNIATRLRQLREAAGFTQKQLADRLGMVQSDISVMENSPKRLRAIEVVRIAAILGVTPEDFYTTPANDLPAEEPAHAR